MPVIAVQVVLVGGEAVLQLRANYLSDIDPMSTFWQLRQKRMTGQPIRPAAA